MTTAHAPDKRATTRQCSICEAPITRQPKAGKCQHCWSKGATFNNRRPEVRLDAPSARADGGCVHHWVCHTHSPNTPATCKKCGAEKVFVPEDLPNQITLPRPKSWTQPIAAINGTYWETMR